MKFGQKSRHSMAGTDSLPIPRPLSVEDDKKGVAVVELFKKEGCGLGLTLTGGVDKGDRARIQSVRPGGIAHRSDSLQSGDVLLSVNGIRTSGLKHDEIINLLKNAGERVILEVEYILPDLPTQSYSVMCKRVEILLEKDGNAFGFTMRGGSNHQDVARSRPLTVTQIRPGSSADREGSLKVGDRILAINGINSTDMPLDDGIILLKRSDENAVLLVEYDVSVMEDVKNVYGPLLIEIDKNPGTSLGLSLTSTSMNGQNIILVESTKEASIADRCGALHTGDQILAIDGTSLEHMTLNEATQLLKSSVGEQIKLEILPLSKIKQKQPPQKPSRVQVPINPGIVIPISTSPASSQYPSNTSLHSTSTYNTISSAGGVSSVSGGGGGGGQGTGKIGSGNFMTFGTFGKSSRGMPPPKPPRRPSSAGSSTSTTVPTLPSYTPGGQVSHQEMTEIFLLAEERGLGLSIQGGIFSNEILNESPIIDFIDPGGPADRCGLIQEGDRLLTVNGQILEGRSLEQVNRMLRETGGKTAVEIEFDVADTVIPSCGTFNVRLAKRGNSLGITISAPKNRQPGECLMVSSVKKGSVAHRSGIIQAGDKLLAIDALRTDDLGIGDAAQILQNVDDIVNLKIKKEENIIDDQENTVIYTVELQRHGGPLGITISGTEEPFDPILISGLTEGGLAERTGALHVGDRILAINNKSLHGRPLSDAIATLQSAGDLVTLKVSRAVDTGSGRFSTLGRSTQSDRDEKVSTPITSVDSALDSWDSQGFEVTSHIHTRPKLKDVHTGVISTAQAKNPSRDSAVSAVSGDSCDTQNDPWESATASSGPSCRNSASTDNTDPDDWSKRIEELQENSDMLNRLEAALKAKRGQGPFSIDAALIKKPGVTASDENLKSLPPPPKYREIDIIQMQQQMQSIFAPTPTELLKVTLYKNTDTDNFGLSLSDGLIEKGVYISAIRPGGPADKCGGLRLYDRILQVNHVKTRDLDCCLVVPLIAASGNQIDLVVSRNPAAQSLMDQSDSQSLCSTTSYQSKTTYKNV